MRPAFWYSVKHLRKFISTEELLSRLQARTVLTGGNPGGSERKPTPGRFI
jgi:hypothetical protein